MEEVKQIDFVKILKAMVKHRKTYYKVLPTAFVVSSLLIICVPRTYRCSVTLAPEMSSMGSNSLAEVASSFGIDLSSGMSGSTDAILPELYPDLMNSVDFHISLFPIKVKTLDGTINTTYYDYLLKYTKSPWWEKVTRNVKSLFEEKAQDSTSRVNPFMLTKRQTAIIKRMEKMITCNVDKKNYVISITVEDQDPLVCATMADSVKNKLQKFITDYRTSKARNDLEYTENLYKEAKARYKKAQQEYVRYADANNDLILYSHIAKREDLENEMQLQFNSYSVISNQLQAARARVQERTPVFTTLQPATVPLKPASPKKMIFVAVVTFLTFVVTTIFVLAKE